MQIECLVVGAGLAGSTAARVLAEAGKTVQVIERLNAAGGHCHDYRDENGITVHTYGPHIFHTNSHVVWDFVNRFACFNQYQHRVLSCIDGKLLPFPINRKTLTELFGITLRQGQEVRDFLKEEANRSKYNNPPENFRDVIVSQVGERLYGLFFKNYTIKQWQRDPEELHPNVAGRIPVRDDDEDRYFTDTYQGIPIAGYTSLIERMLDHPNISLVLDEDYFTIREDIKTELTVYTGELDHFFDYKYGRLQYRSLELRIQTEDREYYQPAAVVNYPNDRDWTRITEFKYFLSENLPKTTICFEYPKAIGEPYYVVLSRDNLEKREFYLKEVKALGKSFIFTGRLAEYQYYNMDQVIKVTHRRIREFLAG